MKRTTAILVAFALAWTLSGCATSPTRPTDEPRSTATETALVVGLYPWVPRVEQFQSALTAAWADVQPDVPLRFLSTDDWDGGYSNDPPPAADVYVFDAMFFEHFRSQGWLEPLHADEIDHLDDFLAYAKDGVEVDGTYYAIPQLGCANILFYQEDDIALAEASTLSELEDALGQCTYSSQIPPDRRGLMIDMSGGTTNASLYLDATHSLTGEYPPPLPWDESELNPNAMTNMRLLLALASYENGTTDVKAPYQRGTWWSDGWGRAAVGYTESMSAMSAETREQTAFKVLPLSDSDNPAMFYADVIAVNTTTRERGTRDLAVKLANVMASSATVVASIGPNDDNPYPQYLMATRPSIFRSLGRSFPIYNEMHELVMASEPVMFSIDERSRDWLTAMKNTIRTDAREAYPCGCDFKTGALITDQSATADICEAACAEHGGWSGSWTNQYPAAPSGASVCGCNACPLP